MNKRDVLAGMRCPRLLWWTLREPGARELDPTEVELDRFAEGRAVGLAAREHLPGREYEVPAAADGVDIRVDILERGPAGAHVIEVKATNEVKSEHIDDVAIQVQTLRAAGVAVASASVLHLNKDARESDRSSLFRRADVTARVEKRLPVIREAIATAGRVAAGPDPRTPIGPQCQPGKEDECPFLGRCWQGTPEHHVSSLYYIGKGWGALAAQGYNTIPDLPEDIELPKAETYRQVRAIRAGKRIVEPGLGNALAAWPGPIATLDFETVETAIPEFAGCAPWEKIPAQFSVHHEAAAGVEPRHHEWIAEPGEDPRPGIARALIDACAGAGTLVAWSASFEKGCVERLRKAVPSLAGELDAVLGRIEDAAPIVRNHVYDPAFGGGFSLKKVQPALVPELPGYETFEVQEGMMASVLLKRLIRREPADPVRRAKVRSDLLQYCAFDTLGLLRVIQALRSMAV